jgi:hypothetical protein
VGLPGKSGTDAAENGVEPPYSIKKNCIDAWNFFQVRAC